MRSGPLSTWRGHADLAPGEVEIGPLERKRLAKAEASARQEQEERIAAPNTTTRASKRDRTQLAQSSNLTRGGLDEPPRLSHGDVSIAVLCRLRGVHRLWTADDDFGRLPSVGYAYEQATTWHTRHPSIGRCERLGGLADHSRPTTSTVLTGGR